MRRTSAPDVLPRYDSDERSGNGSVLLALLLALGVHGLFAWLLSSIELQIEPFAPTEVSFAIVEEPPPEREIEEPPEVEAPPEPQPEPERVREAIVEPERPPQLPAEPQPDPPPAPEPAPVRFDGVMLEGEAGWAIQQSSGADRTEPLANPVGDATDKPPGDPEGQGEAGPPTLRLKDLSRPPRQPDLNLALENNYPARARREGVEGVAVVRIRVEPDGRVRIVRHRSESVAGYGFAEACAKTLRDSPAWSQPVDDQGRPVAVLIDYPCRFSVRY